jgi:leader peptidase (prepilin peptidase) / N-methyltransferase
MQPDFLIVGLLFITGLCVGSFLNVVIWRLPLMLDMQMKHDAEEFLGQKPPSKPPTFNLAWPASHCPQCKKPLRGWQNIPLLSFFLLKGQCGSCKKNIPHRYWIIELFTGLMFVLCLWRFGLTWALPASLGFISLLMVIFWIDWDHQYLPDILSYLLIWSGILINLNHCFIPLTHSILGVVMGYGGFWSIYWAFKIITKKEGLGYGDFKLLAGLGAWLGVLQLPFIILLSSVFTLIALVVREKFYKVHLKQAIAYGPGLVIAGGMLWIFV